MTPPLEALLLYAFAEDRGKLGPVLEYLHQSARRAGVPEAEDEAQRIGFKLFGSPQKARAFFDGMAHRNTPLASAILSTPTGTVPRLAPDLVDQVTRQIAAYIGRSFRNAIVTAHRQQRTEPLPEDDRFRGTTDVETPSDLGPVRLLVLTALESDTDRPAWLDPAIEAVEALATGDASMEDLTAACIEGDPSLRAEDPAVARKRARDRLQKHHQRAREYLSGTIHALHHTGALDDEQARSAGMWIQFLKRRQNPPARPSRRSKP